MTKLSNWIAQPHNRVLVLVWTFIGAVLAGHAVVCFVH